MREREGGEKERVRKGDEQKNAYSFNEMRFRVTIVAWSNRRYARVPPVTRYVGFSHVRSFWTCRLESRGFEIHHQRTKDERVKEQYASHQLTFAPCRGPAPIPRATQRFVYSFHLLPPPLSFSLCAPDTPKLIISVGVRDKGERLYRNGNSGIEYGEASKS